MLKTFTIALFLDITMVGAIGTATVTSEHAVIGIASDGSVVGNGKGLALYFFDKDVVGNSNCNDTCAKELPPFKPDADANAVGEGTFVVRDEKSQMWAF